ncbi:MAG: hypothetical protein WBA17_07580, partial [Saprospiraceae bacterium]
GRSMASLVNPSGFVLIGNQLHYFSDKVHILVADRNQETVKQIIADPEREWELEGVAVTLQEIAERRVEKIDTKFVNGPTSFVAHQETIGNQRLIVTLKTNTFRTNFSNTLTQYSAGINGYINNQRRQGLTWKRTWSVLNLTVVNNGQLSHVIFGIVPPNFNVVTAASITIPVTPVNASNTFSGPAGSNGVADVDLLLTAVQTDLIQSNFSQTAVYLGTRISGRRVTDQTDPNLDVTVGSIN